MFPSYHLLQGVHVYKCTFLKKKKSINNVPESIFQSHVREVHSLAPKQKLLGHPCITLTPH